MKFFAFLMLLSLIFSVKGQDEPAPRLSANRCGGENDLCTYTQGFWGTHCEDARCTIDDDFPWIEPCRQDIELWGGATWLDVLHLSGNDVCVRAGRQYVATRLNVCRGACVNDDIEDLVLTLWELFPIYCPGFSSNTSHPDYQLFEDAVQILDDYNNGVGYTAQNSTLPPHCDDENNNQCPPPPTDDDEDDDDDTTGDDECTACALTRGFWRNHNQYRQNESQNTPWPASCATVDSQGRTIDAEDREFFDSGRTWLEVFSASSRGGDACIIAGAQWVAASLNFCNGVRDGLENGACALDDNDQVITALDNAPAIFERHCGRNDRGLSSQAARRDAQVFNARAQLLNYADTLDNFNNGNFGEVGHCEPGEGNIDVCGASQEANAGDADVESDNDNNSGNSTALAAALAVMVILLFITCAVSITGALVGYFYFTRKINELQN